MGVLAGNLFWGGLLVFFATGLLFYVRLYRTNPAWGFASTLLPPVALVPFTAYARKHPLAALAVVSSAYLAISFGTLWVRMNPQSALLASTPALRNLLAPASAGVPLYERAFPEISVGTNDALTGKIRGVQQRWEVVEWAGDTLRFANSDEAIPSAMVQIRFPDGWIFDENRRHLAVTPNQTDAPVIEIFTSDAARGDTPVISVVKGGYWLDLDVDNTRQNQILGAVSLTLPSPYQTWLTGNFSAYTDGVRYIGKELDRNHDSAETLARIAASHVSAHLWKWMEGSPVVTNVRFQSSYEPFDGQALVKVNLGTQGIFDLPVEFSRGESGWFVVPDVAPMLAANMEMQQVPAAAGTPVTNTPTNPASKPATKPVVSAASESTAITPVFQFGQLNRHRGQKGDVYTLDGRKLSGIVLSADEQQLKLKRIIGLNELTMTVSSSNFAKFVQAP